MINVTYANDEGITEKALNLKEAFKELKNLDFDEKDVFIDHINVEEKDINMDILKKSKYVRIQDKMIGA